MSTLYGLYPDADGAQRAVDALRAASADLRFDADKILIISGEPHEGYAFAEEHHSTQAYRLAAIGGVVGGILGYLLTTMTQHAYPLPTGSMPLAPVWTNGIIVYEVTMLGAILTTLVTLLITSGLPNFKGVITDPEISGGKILVGVTDPPESSRAELERRLLAAGASQVKQSTGN